MSEGDPSHEPKNGFFFRVKTLHRLVSRVCNRTLRAGCSSPHHAGSYV